MAYKGKYKLQNPQKYIGDINNIVYRSLWERQCFKMCETNPEIVMWGSEIIVIPYICRTDGKQHKYFTDLYIEHKNNKKYIIEIKPAIQTICPKRGKKSQRRFIRESRTYIKNISKWEQAHKFAETQGWEFMIWTEKTLRAMGIKIT